MKKRDDYVDKNKTLRIQYLPTSVIIVITLRT